MTGKETLVSSIPDIAQKLKAAALKGVPHDVNYRKKQLNGIAKMLLDNELVFIEAMMKDLKTRREANLEITLILSEVAYAIDNLSKWLRPSYYSKPLAFFTDSHYTMREPLGTVLIIGTWNYPLIITLSPLIGAISGGNCAVLKPSEIAANTANLLMEFMPKYLDPECFAVVCGGINQAQALLAIAWDHIFYTGGGKVGQIVYQAAAKHLTPVILELGGKSPTLVTKYNTDIATVAKRIIFGKTFNSGQTCIAPDYVFCHSSIYEELVKEMIKSLKEMYGDRPDPCDYGYMINEGHHKRVKSLLSNSKLEILHQGEESASERRFFLTLVKPLDMESPIMKEEIFGPILPIISYDDLEEQVISFINSRDKPLALYVFSESKEDVNHILKRTSSGSVVVNDTIIQFASLLPFGGVGPSGLGSYRWDKSFEAFTHEKTVIWKPYGMEWLFRSLGRYPPYKNDRDLASLVILRPLEREVRSGNYSWGCFRFFAALFSFLGWNGSKNKVTPIK